MPLIFASGITQFPCNEVLRAAGTHWLAGKADTTLQLTVADSDADTGTTSTSPSLPTASRVDKENVKAQLPICTSCFGIQQMPPPAPVRPMLGEHSSSAISKDQSDRPRLHARATARPQIVLCDISQPEVRATLKKLSLRQTEQWLDE